MDFLALRTNPRPGACRVRGCRAHVSPGTCNGRFCRRCRDRRFKLRQPLSYAFQKLRSNARRRGHEFTLTCAEFARFCGATGYLESAGKLPGSTSIDRIDSARGYSLDNLQVLTLRENSRKQFVDIRLLDGEDPF